MRTDDTIPQITHRRIQDVSSTRRTSTRCNMSRRCNLHVSRPLFCTQHSKTSSCADTAIHRGSSSQTRICTSSRDKTWEVPRIASKVLPRVDIRCTLRCTFRCTRCVTGAASVAPPCPDTSIPVRYEQHQYRDMAHARIFARLALEPQGLALGPRPRHPSVSAGHATPRRLSQHNVSCRRASRGQG